MGTHIDDVVDRSHLPYMTSPHELAPMLLELAAG